MYFDLFASIPQQAGERKLTLTFAPSFRARSVLFEFYQNEEDWTAYWIQSVLSLKTVFDRLHQEWPDATWEEIQSSPKTVEVLRPLHPVHSCAVDAETAKIVQEICENGLPEPDFKPTGLDGVRYDLKAEGGGHFVCKNRLPKEWAILEGLIAFCVASAGLKQELYGCWGYGRATSREFPEDQTLLDAIRDIFGIETPPNSR